MALDIALPFYGDVGYLKQAVASVQAQTDINWRLIVVDDGYPDASLPSWFASLQDSRIVYQRNEINLGANGNYRHCIELIQSEYCVIMGADDVLLPNFVEHVNDVIRREGTFDVMQPKIEVIDEFGNIVHPIEDSLKSILRAIGVLFKLDSGQKAATLLLLGNWMYFPSIVWRTELLHRFSFRKDFNVCQDLGLLLDVIAGAGVITTTKTCVFQYRRHLNSDSSAKGISGERFVEERDFYRLFSKEFSTRGWRMAGAAAQIRPTSRLNSLRFKIMKRKFS